MSQETFDRTPKNDRERELLRLYIGDLDRISGALRELMSEIAETVEAAHAKEWWSKEP